MCGISGVIKKGVKAKELQEIAKKMNEYQNRRGPDDRGVFVDEASGIALGHTRLSILDLSAAGHQPLQYQKSNIKNQKYGELWITFNGEVYNFQDLRNELEGKGYRFKTKTDTEVILAAYAEWGAESFNKLRGMFAFGLWDGEKKKLYLVKDRYGIKPLYYYADKRELVFASTVKALKVSGMVPDKKNEKAAIGFLLFGSVPLPYTTLEDVYGVPAGHYLEANFTSSQDVNISLVKYYEPLDYFLTSNDARSDVQNIDPLSSDIGSHNIVQKVRSLLEESVRLHLISDAPLGVFLSGGIDSSVLALLASGTYQRKSASKIRVNQRLTTLSITFDEPEFSEKKYQDIITKQIKSNHWEYKITKQDFENSLDDIWEAMDQPTIDGVNTYFVAQAAKKAGLKAVLSGLGADEIFFGYPSFRKAAMLRKIQKGFSFFGHRKSAGLTMSRMLGLLGDKYSKLGYLGSNDMLRFYLAIRGLFVPTEVARILNISESEVNDFIDNMGTSDDLSSDVPNIGGLNFRSSDVQKLHPANLLSYLELKFYLQNQLLKDSDFMAMHHSIEIRVPFLDHKLVEYVSSLPAELKLRPDIKNLKLKIQNSQPKPLLVAAMHDLLPREVWDRAKMGFTFPFQQWLKSSKFTVHSSQLPLRGTHWSRSWVLSVLNKFS